MGKMCVRGVVMAGLGVVLMLWLVARPTHAQVGARLVLVSGSEVPGHPGFTFGPFSDLAMNGNDQIVFRTTLESSRGTVRAVVRSQGVSFSVVAFEGLVSPASHEQYESFSEPCINDAGIVAFKATLKGGGGGAPTEAIVRVDGTRVELVADNASGETSSGFGFKAFSAPVIGSSGAVLFAARTGGADPHSGLYVWAAGGIRQAALPKDFALGPREILEPLFASRDEAVFVKHGGDLAAAREQFFRAVAVRNFQQLDPSPQPADTVQVLPARPNQKPVQMLLVLMQGNEAQTAELAGDPSQPVKAQIASGAAPTGDASFEDIQGQAAGREAGTIIFAGVPSGEADGFGIFAFRDGQVVRLTTQADFGLLLGNLAGKPIGSFAGDGQGTVALVAPVGNQRGANAIFVCDTP
ncbi:MAG TPA: choice-of-anchor tandem repeat NxxGxxAF-containing protein [Terriglobia bacterium]|nr:choice-of-anchor tandem repeat NxxGxxAF-containing protein [Terriglobia bacterium]